MYDRNGRETEAGTAAKTTATSEPANEFLFQSHEDDRNGRAPGELLAGAVELRRYDVIQFSANEAFMAKVDQVRAIASHRLLPNTCLKDVLELSMDYFLQHEDPAARHERRKQRVRPTFAKAPRDSARSIPARIRDEIFVRDKQQCT